jgi:hypothetical protein
MNIEKTVRAALFSEPKKVELSAEKVELAKYDFKQYKKQYDDSFKDQRSKVNQGLGAAKKALDTHYSDVNSILNEMESNFDKFGNEVKDLGLDFRNTPQFNEFQETKKILLSRLSSLKEKLKEISKIM